MPMKQPQSKQGLAALIVLLLAAPAPAVAQADDGVPALKIPISAEAMSLGGVLPMLEGVDAVFFNPSGLAAVGHNAVTMTHAALHADTRLDAVGGASRLGNFGSLGVSAIALTQDAITARNADGLDAGSITAYDAVVGLSWGRSIDDHNIGFGAKHVRQTLADVTAQGFAFDLGYQYRFSRAVLGASVQNAGPAIRFIEESNPLPTTVAFGMKYDVKGILLLNTSIAHRPYVNRTITSLGAELSLGQMTTLRAGYLAPLAADASSAARALSNFGFGLGWRFPSKRFKIDYAMMPGDSDLGMTHRFTMQLGWGKGGGSYSSRSMRDEGLDSPEYTTPFFQAL